MLETKTYYYPVYAYRAFANLDHALNQIIEHFYHDYHKNGWKIKMYADKKLAWEKARGMLCDDDTCIVIEVEVIHENRMVTLKEKERNFTINSPWIYEEIEFVE